MATRPRVGRIPYLCAAPFYHGWDIEVDGFEVITAPPRQLLHLAEQGELQAACLPITGKRRRNFEPLGEFGLAARSGPFALLFTRIEPDLLHRAPIGVSFEAQSAVHLLEYVLRERYGLDRPNLVPLPPDRSGLGGLLLVGDSALRARHNPPTGFGEQVDLVAAWYELTGLPFTFGRWYVHKELDDEQKSALLKGLDWTLTGALADLDEVADAHLKTAGLLDAGDGALAHSEAVAHLRAVAFRLGSDELAGIERLEEFISPKPRRRHPFAHLGDLDQWPIG